MDEKRGTVRIPTNLVIEIYKPDEQKLVGIGHLMDISLGGAKIETTAFMIANAQQLFKFMLGPKHLFSVKGMVRWVQVKQNSRVCGVEFSNLDELHRRHLQVFVKGEPIPPA